MKVLAFAGSNSKNSINKKLAAYAASMINNANVTVLDLNDFPLPVYSIDHEKENGIPQPAHDFLAAIKNTDALVVSLAEHNGNYTAAFKNLFDWMSRIEKNIFQDKPMLLMSTSPGGRGGKTVFEIANAAFPRFSTTIVGNFSLPKFNENFSTEEGKMTNEEMNTALAAEVLKLENHLKG